ncbi:hypothetical protein SPBR_02123 [Sporothrix brasiliensis 5110]|uniref:Uncharacterized protein n=1 Tax=Sporothrix brasiliensis 5110 TaxID=1398154 RepID=A0A0C2FJV1_9PEZI|nr:uncharacterized protein SPBR_02123 [Sporothrix brasiliensis 5110]KIH91313.1 hypothetical protein SPBR_02123 [Sporothrix brasiliensis 5110]
MRSLPNRIKPYAVEATRTSTKSSAENDARSFCCEQTYRHCKALGLVLVVLVAQVDELRLELVLDFAKGRDGCRLGDMRLAEIRRLFGSLLRVTLGSEMR